MMRLASKLEYGLYLNTSMDVVLLVNLLLGFVFFLLVDVQDKCGSGYSENSRDRRSSSRGTSFYGASAFH
jgi:hypothetical protein